METGRIDELIERLASDGVGVSVMPVRQGTPMGGFGTEHFYAFDGWEVGYVSAGGGAELAVGVTVAEAVEAALAALDNEAR